MSYILDALRKAESQRSGAAAHGLSSGVSPSGLTAAQTGRVEKRMARRWRGLGWGLGLCLLVLTAGGWWTLRSAPSAPVAQGVAQVVAQEVLPGPVSASSAPAPSPPASVPAPAPVSSPALPAPGSPTSAAAVAATVPTATAAQAVSAAAPVPAPAPALEWSRLPETTRRAVPPLNGFMYSPDPQARMLLANGQVAREGDTLAPGVVLVRIRENGALLDVHGQRVWWTP